MEAASLPFPPSEPSVRVLDDRLVIERAVLRDASAARVIGGADEPLEALARVVGIGARVVDREDTGQQADFVRAEFERAARELEHEFVDRARRVSERLDVKVDEAFGPESGHVTRALERHFGDGSSSAVQHRVRAVLDEAAKAMREDLRKELSSDGSPIAGFQRATLGAMKQTAEQHATALREVTGKLEAMKLEIADLRAEKERLSQVAAAEERGTAKGRTYEEAVFAAVDAIAAGRDDLCDAVGDVAGAAGKKGDVVVDLDGCSGSPRGRIVFEAKDRRLSRPVAMEELDGCLHDREADFAVLVVPSEEEVPARTHALHEYDGNKLVVVYDPDEPAALALGLAYRLARARVLAIRADGEEVDAVALRAEVERATRALEKASTVRREHTKARNAVDAAGLGLDALVEAVEERLRALDALLDAA